MEEKTQTMAKTTMGNEDMDVETAEIGIDIEDMSTHFPVQNPRQRVPIVHLSAEHASREFSHWPVRECQLLSKKADMKIHKERDSIKCLRGAGPSSSNNGNEASERQTWAHGNDNKLLFLNAAYSSMKNNSKEPAWREYENDVLQQKSPMGNTRLHIAAMYGYEKRVREVLQKAPNLLNVPNSKGDTALHFAAKAGHISCLKMLLDALLRHLALSCSENPKEALEAILGRNDQGNTFFHEALLNGHRGVINLNNFLLVDEELIEGGFKELVERAALFWTNKEGKSVLYLAIEGGNKELVDHAMTKLENQHPDALEILIQNHQELAEMIPHGHDDDPAGRSPLGEQDQGSGMEDQQQQKAGVEMKDKENESQEQAQLIPYGPHYVPPGQSPLLAAIRKQDLGSGMEDQQQHKAGLEMKDKENESQEQAQLIPYGPHYVPPGQSPLLAAIGKERLDILKTILKKKCEWIHLKDKEGRIPLHYAASLGHLKIVEYLLQKCTPCIMERDNHSFFPLHLASCGGHDKVVNELLKHCPDPREILDKYGRNILHIAAENGKFNVVQYILQATNRELQEMINIKDVDGNTPLHLATLHCHPKIVFALTWDTKVDFTSTNKKNQTALDAYFHSTQGNPSLRQRLTWIALKSAGVKHANKLSYSTKVHLPLRSEESAQKQKASNMDPYKDRINTLMLVSTLIITVTFAAGFTLPGGTDSSNPGQGMAVMLNHTLFKLFIFCNAISMYGAISVTIILIWAQLGDITLALLALDVARPLLGITLATLSLAFMIGVHLVISDLSWVATTFLAICVIFILMLLFLYIVLWFPSSSSHKIVRYLSYYPFLFLASRVETDETEG